LLKADKAVRLVWDQNAWEDCQWWQAQDRMVLNRINQLIRDVIRSGNEGIGKPEPVKHDLGGLLVSTYHRRTSARLQDRRRQGQDRCLPLPLRALNPGRSFQVQLPWLEGHDAMHCAAAVAIDDPDLVSASGAGRLLDAWRGPAVVNTLK
jgi:Txe/YoeB family toxin of Txe-Axe toxin-antitoxin module